MSTRNGLSCRGIALARSSGSPTINRPLANLPRVSIPRFPPTSRSTPCRRPGQVGRSTPAKSPTPRWRRSARLVRSKFVGSGLQPKAGALAGSLAYGDQRRLEIARALALRPRLLLLDEPAAGMNPTESADLMRLIRRIRDSGVTVLLIEHHMKVVMGISDRLA